MLLVLDVGNSTTVIGVYDMKEKKLLRSWRMTSLRQTSDEIGLLLSNLMKSADLSPADIKSAVMSSVVPALDNLIAEAIVNYFGVECMKVSVELDLGIEVKYSAPKEVGADRLVNAVAAVSKYGTGTPIIVIDYGTAITFDVISKDGAYLGGVIYPGLMTSIEALFGKTAKLPQVALEAPSAVIGQSTIEAIQSGVIYGNAGMTDRIVSMVKDELGAKECKVIATGGHAELMSRHAKTIQQVDDHLTLDGLRIVYERNEP
ncbi:MAG: type III pantothenate kinase [Synergistaceae bacterium]|nr:type III pantothenate kinase [Synergistaceae bacterium]